MAGEESIDEILRNDTRIGPKELIAEQMDDYGRGSTDKLALDLYDILSKDQLEDAQALIDQYFNENYKTLDDDIEFKTETIEKIEDLEEPAKKQTPEEEPNDVQVTFKKEVKQ